MYAKLSRRYGLRFAAIGALAAWARLVAAQGPTLVADIARAPLPSLGSAPVAVTPVGERIFFIATTREHGAELWVSDGSAAGTHEVADLAPGPRGSQPAFLTPLAPVAGGTLGRVLFVADTPAAGRELWVSDGTPEGTSMVIDLRPGPAGSGPDELTAWRGRVYFFASTDDAGRELWSTDGTASGTTRVIDIRPGPLGSAGSQLTPSGPWLYFTATDGETGLELYRTDGTAQGTTRLGDLLPGDNEAVPSATRLTDVSDRLFCLLAGPTESDARRFPAFVDHATAAVTTVPVDAAEWDPTRVAEFAVVGSSLLLANGVDPFNFQTRFLRLFRIDLNEPSPRVRTLVRDTLVPLYVSAPRLTPVGRAVFAVLNSGFFGPDYPRLVRVDPVSGAHNRDSLGPFKEIGELASINNRLVFTARTADAGPELWTIDPGQAPRRLAVINPGPRGSMPQNLTLANDGTTVYFTAVSAEAGQELWRVTVPALCRPDFDVSGVVDPDDLADFIACYFAAPPCRDGDVDGDGAVTPDDLSEFIARYFEGCPG